LAYDQFTSRSILCGIYDSTQWLVILWQVTFKHFGSLLKDLIGEFYDPKHCHDPYINVRSEHYAGMSKSRRPPPAAPPVAGKPLPPANGKGERNGENLPSTDVNINPVVFDRFTSWINRSQMKKNKKGLTSHQYIELCLLYNM
jgi:hypothetical protein